MRFSEVFYDLKKADDYSEAELHRLARRCEQKVSEGKLDAQEAATEVINEEIKDKSLVPNIEEGVRLIKQLLAVTRDLKPKQ